MLDERNSSLIYLAVGESEIRALLLGNFSLQEINSYAQHFIYTENYTFQKYFEEIDPAAQKGNWDLIFVSANWEEFKYYSSQIICIINKNASLKTALIKLKFTKRSPSNYIKVNKIARMIEAKLYFPLISFEKFKLILPCFDSDSTSAGMQLYNPVSQYQITRNLVLKILIKLNLLNLLLKDFLLLSYYNEELPYVLDFLSKNSESKLSAFALHNSSIGSGTKALIAGISNNKKIENLIKISNSQIRKTLIKNEFDKIKYLSAKGINCGISASELKYVEFSNYSAIYFHNYNSKLKSSGMQINQQHLFFLAELFNKTKAMVEFKNSEPIIGINKRINEMSLTAERYKLAKTMEDVVEKFNSEIWVGLAHRDFVAWNIKYDKKKLFIYDWEWAAVSFPYYDLFHFIIHGTVHLKNATIIDICKRLFTENYYRNIFIDFSKMIKMDISLLNYYLLLYLIDRVSFEAELNQTDELDVNYLVAIDEVLKYVDRLII